MRKVTLLVLFLFVAAFCSLWGEEYDFRQTRWGMSVKEVRASEHWRLLRKEGGEKEYRLVYSASIAGLDGCIVYGFSEYKLRSALYSFSIEESGEALQKYRYLKDNITKKYGKPDSSKSIFSEEKKRELGPFSFVLLLPLAFRSNDYLEKGQLVMETVWTTDFTYITLLVKKEDEKYLIEIGYEHKRWTDDRRKEEEERRNQEEKELFDAI
ncbi:MAG TPA: hypothetical protein VMZ05_04290 [Spirochaetota bacterium]|nr:hypothetical protein [Spirochaetota bacterium]